VKRDGERGELPEDPSASADRGSGKRTKVAVVLVVDDLEDNRELYAYALERAGFVVATAADGAEAVDEARRILPALVIMDLAMPVMDGWEAVRRIRQIPALEDTPILALTAFTDPQSRSSALQAGCDDVLAKPYPPAALAARVTELLRAPGRLASGGSR
jgi:two-component system alkaline phosphatase synthesis response regulator PhoP